MKKTDAAITQEKRPYQPPTMEIATLEATPELLTVSGEFGIGWGGSGDDEEYGD